LNSTRVVVRKNRNKASGEPTGGAVGTGLGWLGWFINSTRVVVYKSKNKPSGEPPGDAAWFWDGCAPELHPRGCS